MTDCLAAYTHCTGYQAYPPYFNVTRDGDEVVITVREPETVKEGINICGIDCHAGEDSCNNYCRTWPLGYVPASPARHTFVRCGEVKSMRIPYDVFVSLMKNFVEQADA